jgi:flagellar motor switch protein FliG
MALPLKKEAPLNGAHKVAAFLLTLEKPVAATLLKQMDAKAMTEVAAAMTILDPRLSENQAIHELYRELSRKLNAGVGPRAQDDSELTVILETSIGRERARTVIAQIHERRRVEHPFAILDEEPLPVLCATLAEESNAAVALVLAHLRPDQSAEVLAALGGERALDVVLRIAAIAPPPTESLIQVANELRERMVEFSKRPRPFAKESALKSVAQMLNMSGETVEKVVMEGLGTASEELLADVKEAMFTWEDIAQVDKRGMQKILGSVETRTLAIALKGCSPEVEQNIMANLSARVRAMVADERELAGPLPMAQINESRNELMKNVRALMEAGEFKPAKAGEELVN